MTNTPICSFAGDRDDAIVEYLYGEAAGDTHAAFAVHLERCRLCRAEVEALGGVRQALTQWAPPEPKLVFETSVPRVGPPLPAPPPGAPVAWAGLRSMPAWAQAAAAVLCVGVAAGAANLRVTYGNDGLSVRTGWLRSDAPGVVEPVADRSTASSLRAELTALSEGIRAQIREDMRAEIKQAAVSAASLREATGDGIANDALLRQIRTLISQSEQRQQRELALRIGDAFNDMQSQRRADLSKIDRTIGLIQNNTGMEVMRQREMLNSLAVRVTQRQ